MVTMVQSIANWHNMHTRVDCTHSLTHLHQHSYNHFVAKGQLSYYRIWNKKIIWKVPQEGVANWSTRRKLPTACLLIGITY